MQAMGEDWRSITGLERKSNTPDWACVSALIEWSVKEMVNFTYFTQ
jgi:hypothetical protein